MTLACYAFLESQNQLDSLPNCDLITNVTGTPLPAFPPDGTQCTTGPADPSTHPIQCNQPVGVTLQPTHCIYVDVRF
jgi:hypothetical protein